VAGLAGLDAWHGRGAGAAHVAAAALLTAFQYAFWTRDYATVWWIEPSFLACAVGGVLLEDWLLYATWRAAAGDPVLGVGRGDMAGGRLLAAALLLPGLLVPFPAAGLLALGHPPVAAAVAAAYVLVVASERHKAGVAANVHLTPPALKSLVVLAFGWPHALAGAAAIAAANELVRTCYAAAIQAEQPPPRRADDP